MVGCGCRWGGGGGGGGAGGLYRIIKKFYEMLINFPIFTLLFVINSEGGNANGFNEYMPLARTAMFVMYCFWLLDPA